MGSNMIGFQAFNFILRISRSGVMDIAFKRKSMGMYFYDNPRNHSGFRVPAYVVPNFKICFMAHWNKDKISYRQNKRPGLLQFVPAMYKDAFQPFPYS